MHSFIAFLVAGILAGSAPLSVVLPPLATHGAEDGEPPERGAGAEMPAENILSPEDRAEILWLARVIYSETKVPEEMRLVAWVVRNRVETGYRGTTYRAVATSAKQFSGLTPGSPDYERNVSLDYEDTGNRSWVAALAIAEEVYTANLDSRPFPKTVRHFYSPHAVSATPFWVDTGELRLKIAAPDGSPPRFAFYDGVK